MCAHVPRLAEIEAKEAAAGVRVSTSDDAAAQAPKSACGNVRTGHSHRLTAGHCWPMRRDALLSGHDCCDVVFVCAAQCYKGDAFRCSTCPHRGKPAFQPGELTGGAVKLDLAGDDI